jgi:PPP family 3-phenylpropionic acid transporter
MSAVLQPFFGMAADRSRYKNTILVLLTAGIVVSLLLLPLGTTYLYVFLMSLLLAAFQSAQTPISETITLESLDIMKKSYGPVRAVGTVGYAATSIVIGILMKQDIRNIFYVTAFLGLLGIASTLTLPKVKGHQSQGNRAPVRELFKDKLLIIFMLFTMIAQLVLSFYQTFFPIYYKSIGGTEGELGVLYFIAAISELPFLFFADKIIGKLGIRLALSLSMGIIALRFLLFFLIRSPWWVYPVVALHGLTYIVFTFSLAIYINKTVKKELRATGQTFNGFIGAGLGRILGSVLGGFLVEAFGIFNVMLSAFIFSAASIAVFIIFCAFVERKHGVSVISAQD